MDMTKEHVVPQHPLPEEIRKMARDETVCKFCGVSYLIHREIKALEDRVKDLETQLKQFQGLEERHSAMKCELDSVLHSQGELRTTINSKDAL